MTSSGILKQSTRCTRDILRYLARPSCRHASTSSNPFPYPTHPNPQPHQVFHSNVCFFHGPDYDLVRIYHPDSPIARNYPPETAQARFQSISKAYDLLRGKSAITGAVLTNRERQVDPARFRPRATRRPRHFDETAGDERWKERVLLGATLLAVVAFVMQTNVSRHRAINQAARGARTTSSEPKHSLADEALAEPTESPLSPRS